MQATAQQELLSLFRTDIIPIAEHTLRVSIPAYTVGQTDILQLLDNWQDLLRAQIMQQRLEAQIRQSLASLDRVVGTFTIPGHPAQAAEPLPAPPRGQPLPPPQEQ